MTPWYESGGGEMGGLQVNKHKSFTGYPGHHTNVNDNQLILDFYSFY